jgi:two-component system, OmpR family, phosphate regulon sensor histidine kinase PhoR
MADDDDSPLRHRSQHARQLLRRRRWDQRRGLGDLDSRAIRLRDPERGLHRAHERTRKNDLCARERALDAGGELHHLGVPLRRERSLRVSEPFASILGAAVAEEDDDPIAAVFFVFRVTSCHRGREYQRVHPLRLLLIVSLAVAAAAGIAFGALLARSGVGTGEAYTIGALVFGAFLVPWAGVFAWAVRRAGDLETLVDRTRYVVRDEQIAITDRKYHGEVDDLARAIEETRLAVVREKAWAAEQRTTLEQIAASIGEGLLALTPRGRVVLANERVREMFDVRGNLLGRPLIEVVRHQTLLAAFEKALQGKASINRIDIGGRQIEIRVFPVQTSSEVAAVALFIDVTEIERLQRVRKEFLDDFSHEVRTPLTGLRSAVETFDHCDLTREQEEQLRHVMLRQLSRLERLARDLAELNRIESGELVLDRKEVDVRELLEDLAAEFQDRANIVLSAAPAPSPARAAEGRGATLGRAHVDRDRIQQIFTNLLDNAVKYGSDQPIEIDIAAEGQQIVVSVSDRGEGIPPADIDRIFNRFYRVDKSRSQHVPGSGLGLAIAKHLVLLHGGSIRAFNREGGGATFEVRLPAIQSARLPEEPCQNFV